MTAGARRFAGDALGAIADLGVLVPLAAALVLVVGLDGGMVLIGAGAMYISAGVRFGIPFPVQPLKALTAVAVARGLGADVVAAAGITIGAVLLVVSLGGTADRLARWFSHTTVRALQLGVGVLLVISAVRLVVDPPAVFAAPPPGAPVLAPLPVPGLPGLAAFATAAVLLVLPQLPLTFGNAVVAVTDVARRAFGQRVAAVTPSAVCRHAGVGNLLVAAAGGMPMCHGSSGLTAHHRLGARTAAMNYGLGASLVAIGVLYGDRAPAVLGQLPVVALAALLAYAGARHALLIADLRGAALAVAVLAGTAGAATGNLLITLILALAAQPFRRGAAASPRALPHDRTATGGGDPTARRR